MATPVRIQDYSFGSILIDGATYDHDVVIDRAAIRPRDEGPSKRLRAEYGHTPVSVGEEIPWVCERLVIGTGASGSLPVTSDVVSEAERRGVELILVPTREAIEVLAEERDDTNAILHLTC